MAAWTQIRQAHDDTARQAGRLTSAFVAVAVLCALPVLGPDSSLLPRNGTIDVPFAGPVGFNVFMVLGPAIMVVLRIHMQIYTEHRERLNRLSRRDLTGRNLTLVPSDNRFLRRFNCFVFYWLLPVELLLFAWKTSVFPFWGGGFLCIAAGVSACHAMLPLRRLPWRWRMRLSVASAIVAGIAVLWYGPVRRPFDLSETELSGRFLFGVDLQGADLISSVLAGADLRRANLSRTSLGGANLMGANLMSADLSEAYASRANLANARLMGAMMMRAVLNGANLSNADLSFAYLDHARAIGTDLSHANLAHASFIGAHLRVANLRGANLEYADLSGAELIDADFTGADLRNVRLDVEGPLRLSQACGDGARLPEGLTLKPCPP